MAWRDRLLTASYRGVEFFIDSEEIEGGKRAEIHEYPERDEPFIEELGKGARTFRVACYILGDDFIDERDKLLDAFETAGPGTLVLPTRGEFSAICLSHRSIQSSDEGRIARIEATFVRAGLNAFPQALSDTREAVLDSVEPGILASSARFLARFTADALPDWVEQSAADGIAAIRDGLRTVVDLVDGPADETASLVRALDDFGDDALDLAREPARMAAEFQSHMLALGELGATPRRLYDTLASSLGALDSLDVTAGVTPHRITAATQSDALREIYRRNVVLELARVSTRVDFESREDALAFADDLGAKLQDEISVAGDVQDDEGLAALQEALGAIVADLDARAKQLPRRTTLELAVSTPALVVAHRAHGDATRDAEIVARNRVRNPAFVPAGEIEILV